MLEQNTLPMGESLPSYCAAEMLCMSLKRTCGDRSQNEACCFSFATALSLVRQEDVEEMTDGTPLVRFIGPAGGYWNSRLYFLVEFEKANLFPCFGILTNVSVGSREPVEYILNSCSPLEFFIMSL